VDRVKEVMAMNKEGNKPADLLVHIEKKVLEKAPDYENVVGQDSLTRFDKAKKQKFKGNKNNNRRKGPEGAQNPAQPKPQVAKGPNPNPNRRPNPNPNAAPATGNADKPNNNKPNVNKPNNRPNRPNRNRPNNNRPKPNNNPPPPAP
jgi:hypothetical protein